MANSTLVNGQITDAVTQCNTNVLADALRQAFITHEANVKVLTDALVQSFITHEANVKVLTDALVQLETNAVRATQQS